MNQMQPPVQTVKSLIKAFAIALALAVILLITVVLPAEYGVDPTGLGEKLGLIALSDPSEEKKLVEPVLCDDNTSVKQDSVQIRVPAMSGVEYKFHMDKGATLEYSWKTNGANLYFDFHGEPQGDKTGYFKSYKESSSHMDSGAQTMPFVGSHGWYWKNESAKAIELTLKTKGVYQILGYR